jgi:NitT/TauT family transport system permease protein
MLKLVALPSAAPQVLTGFRTSIGRCWMIVVGAVNRPNTMGSEF